jgi:hypothetical protein
VGLYDTPLFLLSPRCAREKKIAQVPQPQARATCTCNAIVKSASVSETSGKTALHTLVEKLLPSDFLLQQGIYLQTCAHIELSLWQIVQLADGYDLGTAPEIEHYLKIKRQTRSIVKAARQAVCKLPAPLGVRLAVLARQIGEGIDGRNLVVHGAWFSSPKSDRFNVEHYYSKKTNGLEEWFFVDQTISRRQIALAVEDANRVLLEAVAIRENLRAQRASPPIIPLTRPYGVGTAFKEAASRKA